MGSPFYLAITNCHFSSYEMLLWLWIDVLHTYTHYRLNVTTFATTILHCRLYLSLSHFHKDPLFFLHNSHSLTVVTKVVVLEFLQTKLKNSIRKKTKKNFTSSMRRKILLRLLLMLSWISLSCIWTKSWTVSGPSIIQKLL